jgi:hypothetical protein
VVFTKAVGAYQTATIQNRAVMNARLALISIWVASFAVAIFIVGGYQFVHNRDGIIILTPEDVYEGWQYLAPIYALYLGGILTSWFFSV